jgi:hypothetical protein
MSDPTSKADYPRGIPISPPPGWRPRTTPPPLPQPRQLSANDLLLRLAGIALVSLMVVVCVGVGWLSTQLPRRKDRSEVVAKAASPIENREEKSSSAPDPATSKVEFVPKAETPKEKPKSVALVKEPPKPEPKKPPETKPPETKPSETKPSETKPPETKPPEPSVASLTFAKHILPIMERSCINCHSRMKKRGGLDVSSFTMVMKGGENGKAVIPGQPNDSPLYTQIVEGMMPPGGRKLPEADMKALREWIASGAKGP